MKQRIIYILTLTILLALSACNLDDIVQPDEEGPKAVIQVDVANGETPLIVTFDASDSTSTKPILSYNWNFGDGSYGTGVQVTHTYTTAGEFLASVTVIDELDRQDVADVKITTIQGDKLFVDASYSGSDSNGSEAAPYKTISEAMDKVSEGKTVFVKAGTYSETVTLKEGVTLEGENPKSVIIEPLGVYGIKAKGISSASEIRKIQVANAANSGILCEYNASPEIDDCILENNYYGIKCTNNANPQILQCTFNNNKTGIKVENNSSPEIEKCSFDNNENSIEIDNNCIPEITKNSIQNSLYNGLYIKNFCNPIIEDNTIDSSGDYGIKIEFSSVPTLNNNIFSSNHTYDIKCVDSNSNFDDQGGNVINSCDGCTSCVELIMVEGRYEGTATKADSTEYKLAIEIQQEGPDLSIRIYNEEDGAIPEAPNDSANISISAGQDTIEFISTTLGDTWKLTFEENGHVSGTQTKASDGTLLTISLDKI